MTLEQATVNEVIAKSVALLETKCIRPNGQATDWRSLFAAESQNIAGSDTAAEFEARVNALLARGGLSHVAFFHQTGQRAPARYAINATFCEFDAGSRGRQWLFQDVHDGGPTHTAGIRPGELLLAVNGEPLKPPVLPTFALGADHTVSVENAAGQIREVRIFLPKADSKGKATARPPMAEPTSVVARVIQPGLGYVRIAFFPGVNGQRFARELDSALGNVGDCSRLIVDLRGNLGGFVGSLRLMSYLTPDRLPVGYSMTRKGADSNWQPQQLPCIDRLPASKFDTLKMALRFMVLHRDRSIRLMTEGLGPKPFHGRIVMLVNEHTLSAGEMVAAFAQENGLARIVGARTGGQVLGGGNFSVGHGFTIRFPAAGWYTWRGSVVEGRGVSPDLEVPLSAESLRAGVDNQLDVAVAEAVRL
jgi:carboxyl-terminal processing protease